MNKITVMALLFILLMPFSYAETSLFSGKVITGTDKITDAGTFKFAYEDTGKAAYVQTPSTNLIIPAGDCRSNSLFRVCIKTADYYDKNVTTYVFYYQLGVDIFKLTGSLTSASTASFPSVLQGDSNTIKIKVTNPTQLDISKIAYSEDFAPFEILKYEGSGCQKEGTRITWTGNLPSNYDFSCTITASSRSEGNYKFTGNLTYYNSYETEKKNTDTLSITVLPKQLQNKLMIDGGVEIKMPFYINGSMKNINSDEKLYVLATIEVPGNMAILKRKPQSNKDSKIISYSMNLGPNEEFNYSLYLMAESESKIPVHYLFDYTIKDIRDTIENYTFVQAAEPKPNLTLKSEYEKLIPGQNYIITIAAKNPSGFYDFTGVQATLIAPFNDNTGQKLFKLGKNETYPIFSSTLALPGNEDYSKINWTIPLKLEVGYYFNNEPRSINRTWNLKINQTAKPIVADGISTAQNSSSSENKTGNSTSAEPLNATNAPVTALTHESPPNSMHLIYWISALAACLVVLIIIFKIKRKKKIILPPENPNNRRY